MFGTEAGTTYEEISSGLTVEYRDDGILIYHLSNLDRETVEALGQVSKRHEAEAWLGCFHLLRMINLAEGVIFPTPHATATARQLKEETPEHLKESLAIVGGDATTYQLARIMQSHLAHPGNLEVFETAADALDWLKTRLSGR